MKKNKLNPDSRILHDRGNPLDEVRLNDDYVAVSEENEDFEDLSFEKEWRDFDDFDKSGTF